MPARKSPSKQDVRKAGSGGSAATGAEAVSAALALIERENADLNAFCVVMRDEAEATAKAQTQEARQSASPLHGLPVAIKDIIDVTGQPTRGGSLTRAQAAPADTDATCVARLRAAGAVIVGKTNTVEYAFGGYGTNITVGTPKNPYDRKTHRTPGGSSSGTGVAVGGGLVAAGLGSDTGGSVRIPAAVCGCVGLKTSFGLIGRSGVLPLSTSLDTIGPLTTSVRLAAQFLDVMQGYDAGDPATHGVAPVDPMQDLDRGIGGFRLGRLADADLDHLSPVMRDAYHAAIKLLEKAGATIVPFKPPHSLDEYGRRCGSFLAVEGYHAWQHLADDPNSKLAAPIRARMLAARNVSGAEFVARLERRRRDIPEFLSVLDRIDALVLPTTPVPAIPVADVDERTAIFATYTRFANYLELCGLSVPMGLTPDGLPMGLQIVGRRFDDPLILRIGQAYETVRGPFPARA